MPIRRARVWAANGKSGKRHEQDPRALIVARGWNGIEPRHRKGTLFKDSLLVDLPRLGCDQARLGSRIGPLALWRKRRIVRLAPSGHRVIPQHVCLRLQLSKPMLEDVADAYDAHQPIAMLDRHVANAPPRHQFHHIGDAVVR